ncbi:MAG: hypothetical protein GF308_09980 [Candidatus Heimdallarchaeota archaeon]|nr:hypothetical protein [Candidatus Heimdallarchaeota archaeon]
MTVIITGKKANEGAFTKEVHKRIKELSLYNNQLSSVDLAPLAKCQKLQELWLHNNQLSSVDLAPLAKCQKLQELELDASTSIRWETTDLAPQQLPKGLHSYRKKIRQAHEKYQKKQEEEERKRKETEALRLVAEGQEKLQKGGGLEEARILFEQAEQIAPRLEEVQQGLQAVEEAEQEQEALKLAKQGQEALAQGKVDRARALIDQARKLAPALDVVQQGLQRVKKEERRQEALKLTEKGEAALAKHQLERAEHYFKQALELQPGYSPAVNRQAEVQAQKEKVEELISKGRVLATRDQLKRALSCFKQALTIYPGSQDAELWQETITQKLEHIQQLLDLLPQFPTGVQVSLTRLATLCQLSKERTEEALQLLLQREPSLGIYHELPQVFIPTDETSRALEQLDKRFKGLKKVSPKKNQKKE